MRYEFIENDDYIDELKKYLDTGNMKICSFLVSFEITDEESDPYSIVFLKEEVVRVMDFLVLLKEYRCHLDSNTWDERVLALMMPLIRVLLEGFFKVGYVFSSLEKTGKLDMNVINGKFKKITDGFLSEYQKYSDNYEEVLKGRLNPLDNLDTEGKRGVSLYTMLEETARVLTDGNDEKSILLNSYLLYRYCCFYAHGNMNKGIVKSTDLESFTVVDMARVLEMIASHYASHLNVIFCCENYNRMFKSVFIDRE